MPTFLSFNSNARSEKLKYIACPNQEVCVLEVLSKPSVLWFSFRLGHLFYFFESNIWACTHTNWKMFSSCCFWINYSWRKFVAWLVPFLLLDGWQVVITMFKHVGLLWWQIQGSCWNLTKQLWLFYKYCTKVLSGIKQTSYNEHIYCVILERFNVKCDPFLCPKGGIYM